ncbi:MAG TPA: SDR family oxidoreductase [Bacteroidales bacterium]|nr:SDR family oxidoreductase [Bacteroidales bacterium]
MKDNVVIITGASSGIGYALANEFAARGAILSLAARNEEKLGEMINGYRKRGIRAIAVPTDVSSEADCRELIRKTVEAFGRVDILINNAGISMRALFEEVDLNVLHRLMDVNFWGTVYCSKHALPYLLKTRGSIVGVISVAGYVGLPGRTGYSASKFAVRGFLDTLRTENRKKGLHVLVVAPGFTGTNIRNLSLTADGTPQGKTPRDEGKMMTAEEVARRIIRAIQRRKRSLILTFVEGKLTVFLNKFFPSLVDQLAYSHMAKEPDSPFK